VPARNLRLTIEFDGRGFYGWQFQPDRPTIQGELERALAAIAGSRLTAYGCSRTDAGVSARRYVANFHTESRLGLDRWRRAINHHLPRSILVRDIAETDPSFHARFSARGKTYRYRLVRGRSPLRAAHAWELRWPVDPERVRRALREFLGTRDFRPLCQTADTSGTCTILELELTGSGDELELLVRGDRFLYKLVRRITGAAVEYGAGRLTLADIRAALAGRPHRAFRTAPPEGLLLDSVEY
jgi:tRNA pseudouridine38-40 synthase